jgi:hypothetical protein
VPPHPRSSLRVGSDSADLSLPCRSGLPCRRRAVLSTGTRSLCLHCWSGSFFSFYFRIRGTVSASRPRSRGRLSPSCTAFGGRNGKRRWSEPALCLDWAQWWSNPAHPGAGSGFGARHGKPARRVLSSVEPMSVSARWMGSPSTSSRSSLVRTSAATHCGRRRHTLRFLLTAGQHQSRVPAARPPASRGSESVRGQATASDQPRDDRVRVPHLARAQLVATTAPSETTPRSRASPRPTGACSITNLPSGTCTMRAEW